MVAGPLVSVVVPAFNSARYIERSLDSARLQTYRNIEIVVVDDGSTDRTGAIVEAMARKDRRIRLLRQENAGVAAARNLGIRQTRGSLIAPLDADDLWHPDKLAEQVAAMLSAPDTVGVVYCWSLMIDDRDRISESWRAAMNDYEGNVYAPLAVGNILGSASVPLIRRSYFARVGGYDPELRRSGAQGCEDWKLYLALAEIADFVAVRKILVGYRENPEGMSCDVAQMIRSQRLVQSWMIERARALPPRLLRWQEAAFALYFAGLLRRQRRVLPACFHLARAATLDPLVFGLILPRLLAGQLRLRRVRRVPLRADPNMTGPRRFPNVPVRRGQPGWLANEILARRRAVLSAMSRDLSDASAFEEPRALGV